MTQYINGVQQVSITIPNGSTSATATITAAIGTAFIIGQGCTDTNSGSNDAITQPRVELTNSTTVTAYRNTSDTSTVTVNAYIVDATSNLIKSVQNGTIALTSGQSSNTATITSVTTANTAIAFLGATTTTTGLGINTAWPIMSLTNATTITATCNTSGGSPTAGFCAIEYQGAALNSSVQGFTDSAAPSTTSRTHTITSITLNNGKLVYAGCYSSGTSVSTGDQYGTFATATTITIATNAAPFLSISYGGFVVEYVAGVLNQNAQRGTIAISAGTSGTATITSVVTTNAGAIFAGNATNGTVLQTIRNRLTLTNGTTVTANTNTSSTTTTAWEVHEWVQAGANVENIGWDSARKNTVYPTDVIIPQVQLFQAWMSPKGLPTTNEWEGAAIHNNYSWQEAPQQVNLFQPWFSPQQLQRTIEWMMPPHKNYTFDEAPQQKNLFTADKSPQQLQRTVEWMGALIHKNYTFDEAPQQKNLFRGDISPQQLQRTSEWLGAEPNKIYPDPPFIENWPWQEPWASPQQKQRTTEWLGAQKNKIYPDDVYPQQKNLFNARYSFQYLPTEWLVVKAKVFTDDIVVPNKSPWLAAFGTIPPVVVTDNIEWMPRPKYRPVDDPIIVNSTRWFWALMPPDPMSWYVRPEYQAPPEVPPVYNRAWWVPDQPTPPAPSTDFSWYSPRPYIAVSPNQTTLNNASWQPSFDVVPPPVTAQPFIYLSGPTLRISGLPALPLMS